MIISISGMDNSGKTTQTKRLLELYPEIFIGKFHIADMPSFDKQKYNFEWWFKESTPTEFVHALYRSIEERIKLAKELDRDGKIIIIEKGLDFYDARILSTLLAKGLSLEQAVLLQKSIRREYQLDDIEEIKFYLKPGDFKKESDLDNCSMYQRYLSNNQLILDMMSPNYIEIEPSDIDTVTQNILFEIERRSGNSGKKRVLSRAIYSV